MPSRVPVIALVLVACGVDTPAGDVIDETPGVAAPTDKESVAGAVESQKADWSLDACEQNGWYGDGDCDWFCPKPDPDCKVAVLGPEPKGKPTKYPIILMHGFASSPTNAWAWWRVPDELRKDGHTVVVATVSPFDTPAVRAGQLARIVDAALAGKGKVNLLAHSMGGLDARYLVASLGYGDRVASVTTIASPHRGSYVADVALKLIPGSADTALNALASAFGQTFSTMSADSHVRAAFASISESAAPAFNAANPNDARVYYQSWAGVSSVLGIANEKKDKEACENKRLHGPGIVDRMSPLLVPVAAFVAKGTKTLPNDGMATVASAKWGNFLGCIPADHLDDVGQIKHDAPDAQTGFDHIRFYRNIAYGLAARGF